MGSGGNEGVAAESSRWVIVMFCKCLCEFVRGFCARGFMYECLQMRYYYLVVFFIFITIYVALGEVCILLFGIVLG